MSFADPVVISLLFGVASLCVERIYAIVRRLRHSDCINGRLFNADFGTPTRREGGNAVPGVPLPHSAVRVERVESGHLSFSESKNDPSSVQH